MVRMLRSSLAAGLCLVLGTPWVQAQEGVVIMPPTAPSGTAPAAGGGQLANPGDSAFPGGISAPYSIANPYVQYGVPSTGVGPLGTAYGSPGFAPSPFGQVPGFTNTATLTRHGAHAIFHNPARPDRLWATSVKVNKWDVYVAPAGVTMSTVLGGSTLALHLHGEKVPEVVAFSDSAEKWSRQKLKAPFKGSLVPMVGLRVLVYSTGRTLYAFSSPTGTWGVVDLPEANLLPTVTDDAIWVQHQEWVALFTAESGKWSTLDGSADR